MLLDDDLITIFDSSDLSYAVQYSRVLKLTLFVNNADNANRFYQPAQISQIRKELRHIRDQVNYLLDIIEPKVPGEVSSSTVESKFIVNHKRTKIDHLKIQGHRKRLLHFKEIKKS